jgi:hypothetical protein
MFLKPNNLWRERGSSRKYIGRFAVTVAVALWFFTVYIGGIGKTQLTVAYAKRHKDNYSAIFWLNIKDEEDSLKQSFANQLISADKGFLDL